MESNMKKQSDNLPKAHHAHSAHLAHLAHITNI